MVAEVGRSFSEELKGDSLPGLVGVVVDEVVDVDVVDVVVAGVAGVVVADTAVITVPSFSHVTACWRSSKRTEFGMVCWQSGACAFQCRLRQC